MKVISGGLCHRNHGFHFTGIAVSYDRTGGVTGARILNTHEPSLKKKLDNLCKTSPDVFMKKDDNGAGGMTYTLPKKLISIRTPREKKTLSEDQKKALRTQLTKNISK